MTETFVQGSWVMPCPLTMVSLEFSSISRLEEQNELLDKTFPNAASRSRLLCVCVAKRKGH